jgi:ketosteroid isomerase-like protein
MNIPATGKSMKLKGISVMDIENGKIKSNRDYWDWNSFLKGIGVK